MGHYEDYVAILDRMLVVIRAIDSGETWTTSNSRKGRKGAIGKDPFLEIWYSDFSSEPSCISNDHERLYTFDIPIVIYSSSQTFSEIESGIMGYAFDIEEAFQDDPDLNGLVEYAEVTGCTHDQRPGVTQIVSEIILRVEVRWT